jgi:hypothetical protein
MPLLAIKAVDCSSPVLGLYSKFAFEVYKFAASPDVALSKAG